MQPVWACVDEVLSHLVTLGQPANAIAGFQNRHFGASIQERLRCGQPGGTGAENDGFHVALTRNTGTIENTA